MLAGFAIIRWACGNLRLAKHDSASVAGHRLENVRAKNELRY